MTKKAKNDSPAVIYVRREEDGTCRYFLADKDPAMLMHNVGDRAHLARYTFSDVVEASTDVKLKPRHP
jgi:hypothetical protein